MCLCMYVYEHLYAMHAFVHACVYLFMSDSH